MANILGTAGDDLILPSGSSAGVSGTVTNSGDSIAGGAGQDFIGGGNGQAAFGDSAVLVYGVGALVAGDFLFS